MINLIRSDAITVCLEFDQKGNEELIHAFERVKEMPYKINIFFDRHIIMKKRKIVSEEILFKKSSDWEDCQLLYENQSLIWLMGEETIEYALEKLLECQKNSYIFPAEFGTIGNAANVKHNGFDDIVWKYIK